MWATSSRRRRSRRSARPFESLPSRLTRAIAVWDSRLTRAGRGPRGTSHKEGEYEEARHRDRDGDRSCGDGEHRHRYRSGVRGLRLRVRHPHAGRLIADHVRLELRRLRERQGRPQVHGADRPAEQPCGAWPEEHGRGLRVRHRPRCRSGTASTASTARSFSRAVVRSTSTRPPPR